MSKKTTSKKIIRKTKENTGLRLRKLNSLFTAFTIIGLFLIMSLFMIGEVSAVNGCNITVNDSSGADYTKIQNAIDNANENDTICVGEGTYQENLKIDKDLALLGPNDEISPNDDNDREDEATLKVSDGNLFTVTEDVDVTIRGFTIDGEDADYITESSVDWTFEKNIFENTPDVDGGFGAIYTTEGIMLKFHDNLVHPGAGSFIRSEGSNEASITDNVFEDGNQALHIDDVIGEISGNTFDSNIQGMTLTTREYNSEEVLNITNNIFTDNYRGFGLHGDSEGGVVKIEDNIIKNNEDSDHEGLQIGEFNAEYITIENNTFQNNEDPHIKDNSEKLDLDVILDNNDFGRAIVVRGSPIKVHSIFSSIQDAIDSAESGDTIEVSAGTYKENITIDKSLDLVSTEGAESTLINGTMTIDTSEKVIVDGLTFEKDYFKENAIILEGDNNVTLKNLVLKDIAESYWSRGIFTKKDNTQLTIENSKFINFSIGIYERANSLTVKDTVMSGIGEVGIGLAAGELTVRNSNISVDGSAGKTSGVASVRHGPDTYSSSEGLLVEGSNLYSEGDVDNYHSVLLRTNDEGYTNDQINRVNYSELGGNVSVRSGRTLEATYNYWGSPLPDFNDLISGDVTYEPWCSDEECNESNEVAPVYKDIITKLPYVFNETNNYWFNITLEDDSRVDNASLYIKYPGNESFTKIPLSLDEGENTWYYNITNLSEGNYQYKFWANDSLGNSDNITGVSEFTVANLTENDDIFEGEDYNVPDNKSNVIVENTDSMKDVSVSKDNDNTVSITFNNRPDNKVVFTNDTSLRRSTSDMNLSVDIPENTSMSSSEDWDGKFKIPELTEVTESGKDISLAVGVGSDSKIDFSDAVKVLLPDQQGKKIGWKRGDSNIEEIDECITINGSVQKPDSGSSCYYKEGQDDVIVWTYHFTEFAAYTEEEEDGGTGGGTGGGGGGTTTDDEEDNETVEGNETTEEGNETITGNETTEEETNETQEESDEEGFGGFGGLGGITGAVTGIADGGTGSIMVAAIFLLALIVLVIYKKHGGLPWHNKVKRARSFHKRAEKSYKKGKSDKALKMYNKAEELRRK